MNNSDISYQLMVKKCDTLESIFGERTNVETKKEGRTIFNYEVMFCN